MSNELHQREEHQRATPCVGSGFGLIEQIPQKKVGTPDNIASCALYLCSEGASFITGQTITIDGGFTIK